MKLLVTLLLISLPAYCFGIKCYQCFHSNPPEEGIGSNAACRDATDEHLKDCTEVTIPTELPKSFKGLNFSTIAPSQEKQNGFSCANSIVYGNGEDTAIRGCVATMPDFYEKKPVPGVQGLTGIVRFCNSNGCNSDKAGAGSISSSLVLVVAVLSTLFHVSKM